MNKTVLAGLALAASCAFGTAHADALDDIISSGTLRCAVVLDFPPMGMRDKDNSPEGFDVDYCKDLAKVLGVKAEIVDTTFPQRIPALMSGKVDVAVASTSDTLERAKTVAMSIPYYAFEDVVLTKEGSGIKSWEDLKGKTVGAPAGTYEAGWVEGQIKKWGAGTFRPFQNQADVLLALSQGQIDATVTTTEVGQSNIKSGKYPGFTIAGKTPMVPDYVSIIAPRDEYGLMNYIDLFINQQVRTGRYAELYHKWIGDGEPANLTIPGVYR